jgi:HTH-type transcriptional regulator / antitoxin HigA
MFTVINNEAERLLALAFIEPLLQKGFSNLTTEEDAELYRVSMLIHDYEKVHYAMPLKPQTIMEVVERKMYEMKLRQRDLAKLLGVTENRLSEILNGKRKVNMDFAKRLHLRLNIDADFILRTA